MKKALQIACLMALLPIGGCAWSDVFYNLFGHAYSGGGPSDAARYQDYNDRVRSASGPPAINGAPSSPF